MTQIVPIRWFLLLNIHKIHHIHWVINVIELSTQLTLVPSIVQNSFLRDFQFLFSLNVCVSFKISYYWIFVKKNYKKSSNICATKNDWKKLKNICKMSSIHSKSPYFRAILYCGWFSVVYIYLRLANLIFSSMSCLMMTLFTFWYFFCDFNSVVAALERVEIDELLNRCRFAGRLSEFVHLYSDWHG